jgi:flagellum-specific peptidoglycan hydrolase FlgJ
MSQFGSNLNQSMQSAGGNLVGAALSAADAAGADISQFSQGLGAAILPPVQQAASTVQDTVSQGAQALTSSAPLDTSNLPAIDSSSRQAFAKSFAPYAQYAADKLGVDPTWIAAMAGSESNFGKASGNELFGIKALPGQKGTSMMTHEGEYGGTNMNQTFASYDTPLDAVNAYIDLLQNHYKGAVGAQDLGTFVHGLKQGGYFTAAEGEYKGILQDISGQLAPAMQGAKSVVQGAADTGQTAVNTIKDTAQAAAARTSQFGLGLSSGDAMAACGPAAAMAFAQSFGRNPTVQEAMDLARQVGWSAGQGMAGASSEVALLNKLGIDTHLSQGVNWDQVAKDASSGNPVILDTPDHYYYVDGYNANTGQYHLGTSATDLRANTSKQEWFTPDQIPGLGQGTPRAAIFADHPLTGPGVAKGSPQSQSVGDWLSNSGSQAASAVTQKAEDTMSAVLNTGQDATSGAAAWLDSQRSKLSDKFQSADPGVQDLLNRAGSTVSAGGSAVQDLLNQATSPVTLPPDQQSARDQLASLRPPAPGDTANLGPLQVGPFPEGDSVIPIKVGGVDITKPYNSEEATKALLGPDANPTVASTVNQLLNPVNAFFGPAGYLAGTAAGAGSGAAGQAAQALGLDETGQQVASLAGGLAGGFGPSAVERLAPRALSGGLGLLDLLNAPELAYGSTRTPTESAAEYIARMAGGEEHAGNAAAAAYRAAQDANLQPASGAGLLQRAFDALSAYPEEIAGPIRQFAASTDAPASDIAATVQRWVQDNPLGSARLPDINTAPAARIRDAGQQAVVDIATAVAQRQRGLGAGMAGALPAGEMPGQLGLLPETSYQPGLTEGSGLMGQLGQQLDDARAAGDLAKAQQIARVREMLAPLYGDRQSVMDVGAQAVVPGFEQELTNEGAQLGLRQRPATPAQPAPERFQGPGVPKRDVAAMEGVTDNRYATSPSGGLLEQLGEEIDKANAAGDVARAARIERARQIMEPMYGDRQATMNVNGQQVVPGFEQEVTNRGAQLGLPLRPDNATEAGGLAGQLEELAAGSGARPEVNAEQAPSRNPLSNLGRLIASAFSPTQNLAPDAKAAIEDYANVVGHHSNAAQVLAESEATRNVLSPETIDALSQAERTKATTKMVRSLQDQKLAYPRSSAPQGYKTVTTNPRSQLAGYAFHPSVAGPVRNVTDAGAIANNPLGKAILDIGGVAKSTLFSLSNFHTLTEGLNAAFSSPETLANYGRAFISDSFAQGLRGKMASTFDRAASAGVTGLTQRTLGPDETGTLASTVGKRLVSGGVGAVGGGAASYTEAKAAGKTDVEARQQALIGGAAGALLGGAPVGSRGTVSEILHSALWERAVPMAKATAFDGLVRSGMPDKLAAQVINERFGGLNYAAMGRNPTLQNAMRLGIQAPDWTESTVRNLGAAMPFVGGAGSGQRAKFLGRAIGGTMAVTELANYAMTGHSTMDNQPGHQYEIEMRDPNGSYMYIGVLPGNIQSFLNEGSKLASDDSAKQGSDLINFATARASAPVSGTIDIARTIMAAGSRNPSLNEPYSVSKGGPIAGNLSSLSPIGISQVAQGVNEGGIDPKVAAAMAILGLNPRYTSSGAARPEAGGAPAPARAPAPAPAIAPAPAVKPAPAPARK